MSNFVLWMTISFALNIVCGVIALVNGEGIVRTQGSIALGVVASSAWMAWGIYLLSKGAA